MSRRCNHSDSCVTLSTAPENQSGQVCSKALPSEWKHFSDSSYDGKKAFLVKTFIRSLIHGQLTKKLASENTQMAGKLNDLSLCLSLSLSHTHTNTRTHTHTFPLSHTHTHTISLSLPNINTHTHSFSLSLEIMSHEPTKRSYKPSDLYHNGTNTY